MSVVVVNKAVVVRPPAAPKLARAKVTRNFPPLKVLEQVANPLEGLPETGTIEGNLKQEMSATLKAFYDTIRRDQKRYLDSVDAEYWCCLIFEDRAQKLAFLRGLGFDVNSIGDKYIDGRRAADVLGIELPKANVRYNDGSRGVRTKRN